jgi:hypothetical protein
MGKSGLLQVDRLVLLPHAWSGVEWRGVRLLAAACIEIDLSCLLGLDKIMTFSYWQLLLPLPLEF